MNQPSAEELWDIYSGGDNVIHKEQFFEILDRYHLIDKTEPIPGAVSLDQFDEFFDSYGCKATHEKFDIYPKGTVSRLMGERDEAVSHIDMSYWQGIEIEKLQAEVDRLREIIEASAKALGDERYGNLPQTADLIRKEAGLKPEAVGCGTPYTETRLGEFGEVLNCGESFDDTTWLCPDCQAKASQPIEDRIQKLIDEKMSYGTKPTQKKVQLPKVPINVWEPHTAMYQLIEGYRAVKAHLERKE